MELGSVCEFYKYSVISVVGAGGKTSFMMKLAKELGTQKKALMTTTTKIYVPEKEDYQVMKFGNPNSFFLGKCLKNGIYVYGRAVNEENKIVGASEEELNILKESFDYIIIESDGSKGKPLKGWNDNEPVVYRGTELTVGIIDIQALGLEINDKNVHRTDIFIKLTHAHKAERVNYHHLTKLVTHKEGLFKNSLGKRMLFINKVESSNNKNAAFEFIEYIKSEDIELDYIIIGSLKDEIYEIIHT